MTLITEDLPHSVKQSSVAVMWPSNQGFYKGGLFIYYK